MPRESARRRGRALAMKLLYQVNAGKAGLAQVCAESEDCRRSPARVREFAISLAEGVCRHLGEIDAKIKGELKNWDFDRLAAVDLELLRLAAYEILYCEDISTNIAIDEAIELSRQYSTREASSFVNGVLGSLAARHAPHKRAG